MTTIHLPEKFRVEKYVAGVAGIRALADRFHKNGAGA